MVRTKLIQARHEKGWSQEEAAEQLGVTRGTLSTWECGIKHPHPINILRLCKLYEKDAEVLDLTREWRIISNDPRATGPDPLIILLQDDLLHHLLRLVWMWPSRNTRYHELQAQVMQTTEDDTMKHENNQHLNRREAMRRLALLPIEVWGLTAFGTIVTDPADEILKQCAASITACNYLSNGPYEDRSLAFSIISAFLPTLKQIVEDSLSYRKQAAGLASQGLQLKSSLAYNLENPKRATEYAQQAVIYAEWSDNVTLQTMALRELSIAYYDDNQPKNALEVTLKACFVMEKASIPPRVKSWVYAGLAKYQAQAGNTYEVEKLIGSAYDTFTPSSINERIPGNFYYNQAILLRQEAMAYAYQRHYNKSLNTFAQLLDFQDPHIPAKLPMATVTHCGVLTEAAFVSLKLPKKEKDLSIKLWQAGAEQAQEMRNYLHLQKSRASYELMEVLWADSPEITNLGDLIHL